MAIDVTLSNRWHKLEKEDPVLKAHLDEYLKRKDIISENHPLFGMAMQAVVHEALLEKSDGKQERPSRNHGRKWWPRRQAFAIYASSVSN